MKKKEIKKKYNKEEKRHDSAYEKENKRHEKKHIAELDEAFRSAEKCKKKKRK